MIATFDGGQSETIIIKMQVTIVLHVLLARNVNYGIKVKHFHVHVNLITRVIIEGVCGIFSPK